MVGFRFTSTLRASLPAAALAAAALATVSAPIGADISAAAPATCLPHCDNALYPYTEHLRVTGEETSADAETVLPGGPPPAA